MSRRPCECTPNECDCPSPLLMPEPITVADALKALRMLKEVCDRATPGPWHCDERYAEVTSEIGPSELFMNIEGPKQQDDAAFIVAARAVLPGMVEYLIDDMEHFPSDSFELSPSSTPATYPCIAPIVQWARTREDWSR